VTRDEDLIACQRIWHERVYEPPEAYFGTGGRWRDKETKHGRIKMKHSYFKIQCSDMTTIPILYDNIDIAKYDALNKFKYYGAQRIINTKTGDVVWDIGPVIEMPSFIK
jgi:hypothetical protein